MPRSSETPRISANDLAAYMVASETSKQSIIRRNYDPQPFVVTRYQDARSAIKAHLSDLSRSQNPLKANGTRFAPVAIVSTRIPSSNLKFRTKKDNVAGLQHCDLLAHPSHYTIRQNLKHEVNLGPFAERVSEILARSKYNRSAFGKIWGWGAKHLP